MSRFLRYLPAASHNLSCSNSRVICSLPINRSTNLFFKPLNHHQSLRSYRGGGYIDDYEDHEMDMDDPYAPPEEEEEDEDYYEDELKAQDPVKDDHRAQKGSKLERMKKIEKEKRRAKLALRARIDKLEKVKPGGKARDSEEDYRPKRSDDYEIDDFNEPAPEGSKQVGTPEHPLNEDIQGSTIMLIDGSGKKIGLVDRAVALAKVRASDLDLVQLSPPSVTPPICKVVRYHEWYAAELLKKQSTTAQESKDVKTLMIRKTIAPHDLQTKMNQAKKFLRAGHPVKIVYLELNPVREEWIEFFKGIETHLAGIGKAEDIESKPQAIFHMVRNKQSRKKSEKQSKPEKAAKAQKTESTETAAAEIKQ